VKAIILAAGVGRRLGKNLPKSLMMLPNGKSILENQITILRELGIREILVVVGFKKELVMENCSNVIYVYNPMFHVTNTAKSLERALELIEPDDVMWINGDVFLEAAVVDKVMKENTNAVAVNKAKCGQEEVKYKTNSRGEVIEISKDITDCEGEAVGINKITRKDFLSFLHNLKRCKPMDYFEKAIEMSIKEGVVFRAVDISMYTCLEIDFQEDLDSVWRMLRND